MATVARFGTPAGLDKANRGAPRGRPLYPSKNGQARTTACRDHSSMPTTATRDRLRSLIDILIQSLDDPGRGDDLARRAYLSRFHFDRLIAAGLGEAPAGFRRRLLLEQAA